MTYQTGHVTPWWDQSFKELDYQYGTFVVNDDVEAWTAQGFGGLHLNGAHYPSSRPMPEYTDRFQTWAGWSNVSLTFYRLNTCEALPTHQDRFIRYQKLHNVADPTTIYRCIVFLEDWRSGHYFEIDGVPLMPWQAGDWVTWQYDTPHYAGNFGIDPRYTLQITGIDLHKQF